jgi:hypothetical protein
MYDVHSAFFISIILIPIRVTTSVTSARGPTKNREAFDDAVDRIFCLEFSLLLSVFQENITSLYKIGYQSFIAQFKSQNFDKA